jgi:hypothetical protein
VREGAEDDVGAVPDEEDGCHGKHEAAQPASQFLEFRAGLDFQVTLATDRLWANGKVGLGHLDLTLLTEVFRFTGESS